MRGRRFVVVSLFRSGLFLAALAPLAVACQLQTGTGVGGVQKKREGYFARQGKRQAPLPKGVEPNDLVDADDPTVQTDPLGPLDAADILRIYQDRHAEAMRDRRGREDKKGPDALGKPYRQKEFNILLLSGGGAFGAYPAGVLCGWSTSTKAPGAGGRPVFDVVTGVSSGSFISPFAFLGSEYDGTIRELYTTVTNDDIFKVRRQVRALFAESFVDNGPLRTKIDQSLSPDIVARIAAEHAKGRRLYIGTTNLDTKRLVVWDVGAIASKGGECNRRLIVDIVVASGSIPGFFPSVRFNVDVDGARYEELHVDGAISRSMFFRPPYLPADEAETVGPTLLAGSNLYALVAGKYFPDPEGVRARTISVVGAAVSNLLYVSTRGDLYRFYTYCSLSGMDFFATAIPAELEVTSNSANFDRTEMRKMFEAGFKVGANGAFTPTVKADPKSTAKPPKPYAYADGTPVPFKDPADGWRSTPPGLDAGERGRNRAGIRLKVRKEGGEGPRPQGQDQNPTSPPNVTK